jgi:predicted nucleotide-binding protein
MDDEPSKLHLSDCPDTFQRLVQTVAETFQDTVTWPSINELHLLRQEAGVTSNDFDRHGHSAFDFYNVNGKQMARLNLWAIYDTGRFQRLFTEAHQIVDGAFKDIRRTREAVTLTKGDIARRLRRSESDRYVAEMEYVFSRSPFSYQHHSDHGWQLVVDVLRSEFPTPSVEELFLRRPTKSWAGAATSIISARNIVMSNPTGSKFPANTKIFIVHGRDEGPKNTVARFVSQLGLTPIILHEQPSEGRTLSEKLERHGDVGFAIVLLTPEDVGKKKDDKGKGKDRARQNVILELGYFWGRLGRERVCALVDGDVEKPSDYDGVIYVALDSAGAWQLTLAKELRAVGYKVDLNDTMSVR